MEKITFALVYFHGEGSYSVVRVKDVMKSSDLEKLDLNCFDTEASIDSKWHDGKYYPANYLQFGDNRKEMEKLLDDLLEKKILKADIPIVQGFGESNKRGRPKSKQEAPVVEQSKRQKLALTKENKNRKELELLSRLEKNMYEENDCSTCESLSVEIKVLKKQVKEIAGELSTSREEARRYKEKYKNIKKKYKSRKAEMKENQEAFDTDMVKIGSNLKIEKCRLALCRTGDYSKYTCDILDVVFGRENLAHSVVKGIKGCSKEVLDPGYIEDIQGHVAAKFSVNVSQVRATIRNKLNSASKAIKKNKDD